MTDQPRAANILRSGAVAANILRSGAVAIRTDGHSITRTLASLEAGGAARPMPRAALDKAKMQATDLLERVVMAYEQDVAPGEVGATGSARASTAQPVAGRCPTGLLYGRIQSGKTLAMITFAALAIDNGFRVIVVLTSDNIKLVEQTAQRFGALDSIVKDSTTISNWHSDATHLKKSLAFDSLVLICQKNQSHLASLVAFLDDIGAADYPALIMDDEADQATLDTTLNARTSGRAKAPKFGSAINRRTVMNDRPEEAGESIAETLRHYVFLQVTATPYALLLQNADSTLRPKFTILLEPGDGYTGGEAFFSGPQLEHELPPLSFVAPDESEQLDRGVKQPPAGLTAALASFLVAAGAQSVLDPAMWSRAQNFLCHTSQKRAEHEKLAGLVRSYLDAVSDELRKPTFDGEIAIDFARAHEHLQRTLSIAPPLDSIVDDLRQRLTRRQVIVVNSDGANAEFTRGINFIVGGNILGRGLTIENLLVTYYLRHAKISQMDTMLQHARMFGYRAPLMPFTRVFLPKRLALRFHRIHTAEQHLRDLLSEPGTVARIPIEVSPELKATRAGVLEKGKIVTYIPGQHIYPAGPLTTVDAWTKHEAAKAAVLALGGRFGDASDGEHEARSISLEQLVNLVGLLPYDPTDEDSWDPQSIQDLLRRSARRFGDSGRLYTRAIHRKSIVEGALSGDELKALRRHGVPVLCVFADRHGEFKLDNGTTYEQEYTYPSLVIPTVDGMPAHVYNVTD